MIITDYDAAYAELEVLAQRIGWYTMYRACVRYLSFGHTLTVPNTSDIPLFRDAARVLNDGIEERKKMDKKKVG